MSFGPVTSYSGVLINRCPSESSKSITNEACQSSAPSTEGYRNQQFMDITDGLDEPPPYQAVEEYLRPREPVVEGQRPEGS